MNRLHTALVFTALLNTSTAWAGAAGTLEGDAPWTDCSPHRTGFVTANGVRLHYLDWGGSGEPLLLLTGMGNSAHIYDDLAPQFTDRFHVLALTRRGHGESEKPDTGYDRATLVEDIRQFLDAMKLQSVSLVGHSMAGDELTLFATQYPDRVRNLVYLDAAYDRSPGLRPFIDELDALSLPWPKQDNASLDAARDWMRRFYRTLTPAIEADLRATTVVRADGALEDVVPASRYSELRRLSLSNPDYPAVRAPAFCFYAEDDMPEFILAENRRKAESCLEAQRRWQTAEIEKVRKGMQHARIVIMPDTSHFCFIQREAEVVREMRAFLSEAQ